MAPMLGEFEDYLRNVQKLSSGNREACMRVCRKLTNGTGVRHYKKQGVFCEGRYITLFDDLDRLRQAAKEWLPYEKSDPDRLDRGNGWALNHPIQKLIEFKAWKLANSHEKTSATPPPPAKTHELDSSDSEDEGGGAEDGVGNGAENGDKNGDKNEGACAPAQNAATSAIVVGTIANTHLEKPLEFMDLDDADDADVEHVNDSGAVVLYGESDGASYNPPMPTEYEKVLRTCYLNVTLCKYLKAKKLYTRAHPKMKDHIRKFYIDNPRYLENTGLLFGSFAVDHVVPQHLGGLDHINNFVLMPTGVNSHFGASWTAAKRRYVGVHAVKGAIAVMHFFRKDQYEFDFSAFDPMRFHAA